MAAGATAAPTAHGLPKIDHNNDRPDEVGINSIVDSVDALIVGAISLAGVADVVIAGGTTEAAPTVIATTAALVLTTAQLVEVTLFTSQISIAVGGPGGISLWGAKDAGGATDLGRLFALSSVEQVPGLSIIVSLAAGSWVLSARGWAGAGAALTVKGGGGGVGIHLPIRLRARIT